MRISDWSSDVCSSDLIALSNWSITHRACVRKDSPASVVRTPRGPRSNKVTPRFSSSNLMHRNHPHHPTHARHREHNHVAHHLGRVFEHIELHQDRKRVV